MPKREHDEMVEAMKKPVSLKQCMRYFISCIEHGADIPRVVKTPDELTSDTVLAYNHGTMKKQVYILFLERLKYPMSQHDYASIIDVCLQHNADIPRRIIPQDEVTTPNLSLDM